ncbi:hypothetical protein KFE98_12590 [bacterium SCSIO 12741]|nr:hypothetical protein KFE98_12590 [bacterium SCSIO 12741]
MASVSWTPLMKKGKGYFYEAYVFENGTHVCSWLDGETFNFVQYDADLELKKSFQVEWPHQSVKGKCFLIDMWQFGEKIVIFTRQKVKSEEQFYLYAMVIDPATLTVEKDHFLIGKQKFLRSYGKELFDVIPDKTGKHLFFGYNSAESGEDDLYYQIYLFDQNMEVAFERQVEMGEGEALYTRDVAFNEKGDVALLAYRAKEKQERVKGESSFYYTVGVLRDGDDEPITNKIDFGENWISGAGIGFDANSEVIVAGYYSGIRPNRVNGSFITREENGDMTPVSFHEYSIEEIGRFLSEKGEKKAKKKEEKGKELELPDYDVLEVHEFKGSVFMVGEMDYVVESTRYDANGNMYTTYYYHQEDAMVTRFDSDGNIEWMTRIPKHHITTNNGRSPRGSHLFTRIGDDLVFVYNDHLRNHTEYNPKKIYTCPSGGDESVTAVAKIDLDGDLTRDFLYNVEDEAIFTLVNLGTVDPRGGFFLYTYKKKNYKLAYIRFEE